jgi:hypothetical protein
MRHDKDCPCEPCKAERKSPLYSGMALEIKGLQSQLATQGEWQKAARGLLWMCKIRLRNTDPGHMVTQTQNLISALEAFLAPTTPADAEAGQVLTNPMTEADLVIEAMQQEKAEAGKCPVCSKEPFVCGIDHTEMVLVRRIALAAVMEWVEENPYFGDGGIPERSVDDLKAALGKEKPGEER